MQHVDAVIKRTSRDLPGSLADAKDTVTGVAADNAGSDQALTSDRGHGPANWHSGRLRDKSGRTSVEQAMKRAAADPVLKQYREKRAEVGDDPESQLALADGSSIGVMIGKLREAAGQESLATGKSADAPTWATNSGSMSSMMACMVCML